jgi:GDPmannose 4,6-dehydratase
MNKTALIWGAAGQSGSYLAELLLSKDYNVVGITRRSGTANRWRLEKALKQEKFKLIEGDITDFANIISLLNKYKPDEIYNAAAQSHVATSYEQPLYTWDVTAKGQLNLLEAIRQVSPLTKSLFFASSEMFGDQYTSRPTQYDERNEPCEFEKFQNEHTKLNPQSPYAIAKLAAFNATKLYRESYDLKACSGIFFNKESPRRGINFVTRKITSYFYLLKKNGFTGKLKLGNLSAMRDWSYVPDIMYGAWLMLQQESPKDYVFGTGKTHTVEHFLDVVANIHGKDWKDFVDIDLSLFRPAEVPYLRADASLARKELSWESRTSFERLVEIMTTEENGLS